MTQSVEDDLAAAYQEFVDDGGPVDGFVECILDPEEARKLTRCPSARAVYKSSAATLWPHKLVLHLLRLCIEKHRLNLQTHTPVREVLQKTGGWIVKTDRGDVATAQVVYATNAFTATLLPEFLGRIWPMKGQCSVVIPTKSYSGSDNMLTASYNLVRSWLSSFKLSLKKLRQTENEYLMQRPKDGVIIYGGGRRFMPIEKLRGNTDDSAPYPEVIKGLKAELPLYFEGWGDEALGEGMMHAWSGQLRP
jgi:glycine/D-amino acid oxidase-like deaminating enzyme